MTQEQLIIQCKKQDAHAQGALYQEYSGVLFAICLRYSPNYEEAQDSLQDAFLTIFKKIEQYSGKGSFEGWIKRVTVNTVLQKYRKKRHFDIVREDQIADEIDDEDEETEIPLNALLQMVQELPDQYRLVFSMYVLDGYSHKEIGELLGISNGTSKSNLARARKILQKKVNQFNAAAD
ncbi:putative RNA polymerase ECF-type sigma factor [unidentified eubacterium SCB49]|nr:putative RNA polymerase ECF-type sigma factor [unidentified eubacterium SCB49]